MYGVNIPPRSSGYNPTKIVYINMFKPSNPSNPNNLSVEHPHRVLDARIYTVSTSVLKFSNSKSTNSSIYLVLPSCKLAGQWPYLIYF